MSIREPFYYKENVIYYYNGSDVAEPEAGDIEVDLLADFSDVYPFGYPTEQFIANVKNDVHRAFVKLREDKKKALAAMKRELMEGNASMFTAERTRE